MTTLQLLAELAHAVEVSNLSQFYQLQERASQLLLTNAEQEQVDRVVAVLELALENS